MGSRDFWSGHENEAGSHLIVRDIQGQLDYDMGQRIGRRRARVPRLRGTSTDAAGFSKASLVLAALGAIGGLGYGVWVLLTDQVSPGLGPDAITVLMWSGIGAVAGGLLPAALIVGLSLALLGGILFALGHLLNFLTNL